MSRGSKVQKYAYKAKVAQRKATTRAIAAETDAKLFKYLEGAGRPSSKNSISSRSWGAGTYTGWIAEEYVSGHSSDFRPREIKSTRYYYQYDVGNPDNWASMKPGKRKARIQYKGEDDWQRKINAAYWGKSTLENKASELRAAIPIAHDHKSSHWSYVSGSSYGGGDGRGGYVKRGGGQVGRSGESKTNINTGKTKATGQTHSSQPKGIPSISNLNLGQLYNVASSRSVGQSVNTMPIDASTMSLEEIKGMVSLKGAVKPKTASGQDAATDMSSPLYNYLSPETKAKMVAPKASKPRPKASQIQGEGEWGMGGGLTWDPKLKEQEERAIAENPILTKSTKNPEYDKKGKRTWNQIVKDSMYKSGYIGERLDDRVIQDMDKILGKPTDTSDWQSYWKQAAERKSKDSADVTTGMIYDYYTQQIKSKEAEKKRLDQQIGQVIGEQETLEQGSKSSDTKLFEKAPTLEVAELPGKVFASAEFDGKPYVDADGKPSNIPYLGGETPQERRKKGKVNQRSYDKGRYAGLSLSEITKSQEKYSDNIDWLATARSEMAKVEKDITRLTETRGTLQTREERLAEAKAINEQTTARKQAKSFIKHYDPVGVNYLNPESVESYHRRFKDAEILTQQNVRATYTQYLSPTTTVIRGPIKDKDSQIEGVRTGRIDTKERGIYLQAAGEWYQLTAQERKEFEEVARIHEGVGRVAGLDPDKPRTHMRWRRAARKTEELIPKMEGYIQARDDRLKELYKEKEMSNEEYSRHTTKITRLAKEAKTTYRDKKGAVSSDDIYDIGYIKELAEYAKEREGIRYAISVLESERDIMKKDLKTTEDANEALKKQLKDIDRENLAHGGGGGFLRPRSGPPGTARYHAAVGQARIRRAGMAMNYRQVSQGVERKGRGFKRKRTRSGLGGLVV